MKRDEEKIRAQVFADAVTAYDNLPEAMSTTKCPKCLYGEFDAHQGLETAFVIRAWDGRKWHGHPSQPSRYVAAAELLLRSCPRCGHEFHERSADSTGVMTRGQWLGRCG